MHNPSNDRQQRTLRLQQPHMSWPAGWRLSVLLVLSALAGCGLTPPASAAQPLRPTPIPAPAPYPTMEPRRWLGGSDPHATFQLAGTTLDVHLAVHPTQGWPAIAIMQRFNEGSDPIQSYIRVLNPHSGQQNLCQPKKNSDE